MENTIVIKPSARREDLPSYDTIVTDNVALSFAASIQRVENLKYIVVTDGENRAVIGEITSVEVAENNPNGMGRVDIRFENVRELENLFDDVHELINWNNRRNIRYIYFEPDSLV